MEITFNENQDGKQAVGFFPNGYGYSIIQNAFSYGSELGLYEIAVLKGNGAYAEICYDTEITEDVIGHLTLDEATQVAEKIKNLEDITLSNSSK